MKYLRYNINETKERIYNDKLENKCRKNQKDFTRKRKLTARDLLLYTINNRGKTTKMYLKNLQRNHWLIFMRNFQMK